MFIDEIINPWDSPQLLNVVDKMDEARREEVESAAKCPEKESAQ